MAEFDSPLLDAAPPESEGAELIRLAGEVDPLLSQWSRFRDLFKAELEGGLWTVEDLEQRIAHRRAFFFPGKAAALVGQIEVYPGGERVFQFLWSVGDVAEIATLIPGCEALARMMGCTAVLIEGTADWRRTLKAQAYTLWSVTLHKAL